MGASNSQAAGRWKGGRKMNSYERDARLAQQVGWIALVVAAGLAAWAIASDAPIPFYLTAMALGVSVANFLVAAIFRRP